MTLREVRFFGVGVAFAMILHCVLWQEWSGLVFGVLYGLVGWYLTSTKGAPNA